MRASSQWVLISQEREAAWGRGLRTLLALSTLQCTPDTSDIPGLKVPEQSSLLRCLSEQPKKRKVPEPLQLAATLVYKMWDPGLQCGKGAERVQSSEGGSDPTGARALSYSRETSGSPHLLVLDPFSPAALGHPLLFWVSVRGLACVTAMELSGTRLLAG